LWAEQASRALTDQLAGSFDDPATVFAVVTVDSVGPISRASPPDTPADGRVEIGSVTKTMTGTLLASLAADGTLGLDDAVGTWLDGGANGGITLRQLATHTSGLPGVPPNYDLRQTDRLNPWAAFTPELAAQGLRQAEVRADPGWQYSNFGYQLLGLVLERASGEDYPSLLSERLLRPLEMTGSGMGKPDDATFLPGHVGGREVPHRDHPVPGPGGVHVTIDDLARYTCACLSPPLSPIGAAIAAAQQPLAAIDVGNQQALGWIVVNDNLRGHTGGTTGFSCCLIVDPAQNRAVAMLASTHGCAERLTRAARQVLVTDNPDSSHPSGGN
jgi:D-alanyl-D-alanine-carboxypeptidase/D-alanyl-D-alanine-endopeptidase